VNVTTCTNCGGGIDGTLLPGTDVYAEMARGNDREDILEAYSGIRYKNTAFCAACLDDPSACPDCDGTGTLDTGSGGDTATESCSTCEGTGTTKPDLLRTCCR
jgi:DnaJ-class molecular chaperone